MAAALACGCLLLDPSPASANVNAFGIRGGFTDDPDTLFMGGHVAIHPRSVMRLRIEPSLDLGFGDDYGDFFMLRVNANFKYLFPLSRSAAIYPLFGPSLTYYSLDDCAGDCDDTEFGLNLGGGVDISGFGFDLFAGISDIPDITFAISYTFW